WTIDFHVAQNNGTVHGSGTHDKTGRHCMATDASGKLDIPKHAGYWLRNEAGAPVKRLRHICWDGCMFPNDVMMKQQTWNDILGEGRCALDEAHVDDRSRIPRRVRTKRATAGQIDYEAHIVRERVTPTLRLLMLHQAGEDHTARPPRPASRRTHAHHLPADN